MWSCLALIVALIAILFGESAAKKECPNRCGDMSIEKPFGIGPDCSHNEYFAVTCSKASSNPKPILTKLNLELLKYYGFMRNGQMTVNIPVAKACADAKNANGSSLNLSGSPFYIDINSNVFGSIGCDGSATAYDQTGGVIGGCTSTCDPANKIGGCSGYGCCRSAISVKDDNGHGSFSINISVSKVGSCRSAFFISKKDYLNFNATVVSDSLVVPIVLSWQNHHTSLGGQIFVFLPAGGVVLAMLLGSLLVSCGCLWSCWFCKTKEARKAAKLRAKYFKGKLEQSSSRDTVYVTKLFTEKELKIATHNFNGDRIIGEGGQGVVYKGMLPNGQIVAVKRSKTFEESHWKQFINEVILLSQVNHRNVVKLLGCCLETKLPLVVYEFISNGTLSHCIHNPTSELVPMWEIRVRIAYEAADAIAYLHSSSSTPIYHRDIKSNNILLDDKFQAKVADFGISKAIPTDQTHLTTCVRGTFGYLDPEYFRSNHYSDKSDVYSFGVILIELLTRELPIRTTTSNEEERSLVEYFISAMNEFSLDNILDPLVLEGSTKEDVMLVANLAKRCLNSRGVERPTMKEVATELERLRTKLFSDKATAVREFPLEIEHVLSIPTEMMDSAYTTSAICELVNASYDDHFNDEQPLFSTI